MKIGIPFIKIADRVADLRWYSSSSHLLPVPRACSSARSHRRCRMKNSAQSSGIGAYKCIYSAVYIYLGGKSWPSLAYLSPGTAKL
jgi:hypothetical protein